MRISRIGSRYAVIEIRSTEEFTTFLNPIPETERIARAIEKRTSDPVKQLELITRWVHENITYMPDWLTSGKGECFSSPRETLRRRAGDCEDMSFLICSIANALRRRPKPVYVTIGYYRPPYRQPRSFHAWAYCGGVVCEGTAGFITGKDDERYHPIFGIQRDAIYIFKPVRYFLEKEEGADIMDVISSPAVGVLATAAVPVVTAGVKTLIEEVKKRG